MGHGVQPLDCAVRSRRADIVALLYRHGATVKHPERGGYGDVRNGGYRISLLSKGAVARSPGIMELLLEHGATISRSRALHVAAERDNLNNIRFLIERGADVDEILASDEQPMGDRPMHYTWTPMQFAASHRNVDTMGLLESKGARADVKDKEGRSPAQLLEGRMKEHRLVEGQKS